MSCGAKYSVPDGRLAAAGSSGLRIRCSRCRAIMVVSEANRALFGEVVTPSGGVQVPAGLSARAERGDGEETKKELRHVRRRQTAAGGVVEMGLLVSSGEGDVPVPAVLSTSGVFRPLEGVNRQVTGLFFPELDELQREGKPVSTRVWYAALGGRPRGPYSASEVITLAQKGKVRDATLVWRPGFAAWKRVQDGDAGTAEDLAWLKNIVTARKMREREADERAKARGFSTLNLTRSSAGGLASFAVSRSGAVSLSSPGMPPLPVDDDAPRSRILPGTLLADLDGPREGTPSPFSWRVEDLPPARALGVRRRTDRILTALATAAAVVVVAAVAVEAWRAGLLTSVLESVRAVALGLTPR